MNILIAPNSMKGSLSAFDFADTVEKALLDYSAHFKTRKVPVADGGDFTGEVLQRAFNATIKKLEVIGPFGEMVQSKYSIAGNTAIIEMADASGMKLVDANLLNPVKASTFGTGQLILDAINNGCTEILLAVGGSATVDGGMGMMEALGFQFFDENDNLLTGNGANLKKIKSIKKPEFSEKVSFKIICDVDNPLLGKNGAAAVFGPQKGATPDMVIELEKGLKNWAEIIKKETGKDTIQLKGAGAAGGISVPLIAFFNAEIVQGADFVLSRLQFEKHVQWADLIITGEGKIDTQTLNNKAPFAVAKMAKKYKKPVFAFAGIAEKENLPNFDGIFGLVNHLISVENAIQNAQNLLYQLTIEFAQSIDSSVKKSK